MGTTIYILKRDEENIFATTSYDRLVDCFKADYKRETKTRSIREVRGAVLDFRFYNYYTVASTGMRYTVQKFYE